MKLRLEPFVLSMSEGRKVTVVCLKYNSIILTLTKLHCYFLLINLLTVYIVGSTILYVRKNDNLSQVKIISVFNLFFMPLL